MKEKKAKKIRRPNRVIFVLVSMLLAIWLVINVIVVNVVGPYTGFIQNFLSSPPGTESAAEATEKAAQITEEVENEGIILLTNNGSLPLQTNKVNVFGAGSINWTYGGTGSGSGDSTNNVNLYDGLKNAGFEVNEELYQFTKDHTATKEDMGMVGTDFTMFEIPATEYSDELLGGAKSFSDTAIVVFSRTGGESTDCPRDASVCGGDAGKHYLELQDAELELLARTEELFENVIVIINSPNVMELGFLDDEKVDAALWTGVTGSRGCNAIGNVLSGVVNPSGRTADIFAYEAESAPSYYNFGAYDYSNITYANTASFAGTSGAENGEDNYHYVEYAEGIYVGYHYYETAAADGYIDYDETVQFPFGYGLSYTTFEETIEDFSANGDDIKVVVNVKNTGTVPGKDVAEIYYSAPYTVGGIEKSHVVLAGFAKTSELKPGESEKVTISFAKEDMASYDYSGIKSDKGAYVLEAGEYQINLQKDSHHVVDSRTVTIDRDYIYDDSHDGKRESDDIAAINQFDDVSYGTDITYVTRADWEGTMPTKQAVTEKQASEEIVRRLQDGTQFDIDQSVEDIVVAKHGLKLADMKGLDYDDPLWDDLMEQVSVKEMKMLIGNGGWMTMAVKSVDKPFQTECDGPNGINNLMANMFSGVNGNQYTGESVLAQSWNTDLAYRVGYTMGDEFKEYGITGVYGPAMNIHRSIFSGRNYEYYSEDAKLSGLMAAAEVKGFGDAGIYTYIKHFVANDQETNRDNGGLVTWLNEQSLREVYMKPFELAVKEGGSTAVMSSFNRIGTVPTAESYPLLTTVLRDEWGFRGTVITDCVMSCTTEEINASILAGNDLQLNIIQQGSIKSDEAYQRQALRRATKNILYTVANSDALEIADQGMPTVQKICLLVDVFVFALFFLYYYLRHKKMKRWKESLIQVKENE